MFLNFSIKIKSLKWSNTEAACAHNLSKCQYKYHPVHTVIVIPLELFDDSLRSTSFARTSSELVLGHASWLLFSIFAVLVLADMLPKKLRACHTVGANYLHLTRILEYRLK